MRVLAPARKPFLRGLPRRLAVAIALALAGLMLVASPALANFITPKAGGSPNANSIRDLYQILLYIAAVVFVVVEGALVYSLIRFRARRGAVASQIHGNTRLEIGWTVGAALILVVITTVTFIKLPSIINPPNSDANGLVLTASTTAPTPPNGKKLTICVQGRQFIWRYVYGPGCQSDAFGGKLPYSYTQMVVPSNTTIVLQITAIDVIHSWWIPSLGGKVDAVPGFTTYAWFKVSSPGHLFHGQCAQLCGREHYAMRATVLVMSPSDYQQWLSRQAALIQRANGQVTQLRQVLTQSGNL